MFNRSELLELFDLERVQKGGAVFDINKLDWLNREHMKRLAPEELRKRAQTFCSTSEVEQFSEKFLPLFLERINKFGDISQMLREGGEFDFLLIKPKVSKELLVGKSGASEEEIRKHLTYILEKGTDKETVWPYAEQMGKGKVLWPMRVALSGKEKSPEPFILANALGKKESLARIKTALDVLS